MIRLLIYNDFAGFMIVEEEIFKIEQLKEFAAVDAAWRGHIVQLLFSSAR